MASSGRFTGGERRGLIALIILMIVVTLLLTLCGRYGHRSRSHGNDSGPALAIEAVGDSAAAVKDGAPKGRAKKKKSVKAPAAPHVPRSPLDEGLN